MPLLSQECLKHSLKLLPSIAASLSPLKATSPAIQATKYFSNSSGLMAAKTRLRVP
jgi:hypothetical protein